MVKEKEAVRVDIEGKQFSLPLITDNLGNRAIDITRLRKDTGLITYDPGLGSTATCMSALSTVNGEKGILKYRGYDIEDLAENCEFVEVAHLLVKGELPNAAQRQKFGDMLNSYSMLDMDLQTAIRNFPKTAHPMCILNAMVASLPAFYPEMQELDPARNVDLTVARMLSKMRTLAAFIYRQQKGLPFVNPSYKYKYCENLLNMMFSVPVSEYQPPACHKKALDTLLILHADHDQNCSTTAVRLVGSAEANLYTSISAGVSALWGAKHGGAAQAMMDTLVMMDREGITPSQLIEKAKTTDYRIPGFGHRVYKTYDPRAKIAGKVCREVLEKTPEEGSKLLDLAVELEELALKDDYFVSRNLYPNVDFYTGLTYHAMGIPVNMYTVMFAVGRVPGWIAQYLEWNTDPYKMLARPRQLYFGEPSRKVLPIEERK